MDEKQYRGSSDMERHAQSLLTLLAVALLIWVGSTTQDAAVKIAAQVNSLQTRIALPSPTVTLLVDQNREIRERILRLEDDRRID
jgi:hypothetical protein